MTKTNITHSRRRRLIKKYGLPENASDNQILEAIEKSELTPPGLKAHSRALRKTRKVRSGSDQAK